MKFSLHFIVLLLLALFCGPISAEATVVRILTPLGLVDIVLYDIEVPQTVNNFLAYVNRGDYDGSFIHRSLPGFVLQGGGYIVESSTEKILTIATDPPVANEYSPLRSNQRGTIAMAKLSNDPDSATSQWFINLNDNSANLDDQNGGFTVFGEVMGRGMKVVDALSELTVVNAGGAFENLPLLSDPVGGSVATSQLVSISHIAVLPTVAAEPIDRLFNYLEQSFPEYIAPAGSVTGLIDGYQYRYYPGTNAYVGSRAGEIYYLGPISDNEILDIGTFVDWYRQVAAAGY